MAVTLNRCLEMLGRATGLFVSDSSSGGGSTTTLVDTSIYRYDINTLTNKWLYIVSATNTTINGSSRRISGIHASNGTITVIGAMAASTSSGDTYYIVNFDPQIMTDAIQQATRTLYPHLYLPTRDETIVVDNLLANWDFENWDSTGSNSAVATSWANIGTPSTNDESSRVAHGSYSMSVAATGATEGIEQNIFTSVNINEVASKTLHARAWVWASVADAARIRVTYDGSNYDSSNYHTGDSEWEGPSLIYVDSAIDADMTELTVSCEVASGNTAYFDGVVAWIDNVSEYDLPSTVIRGPHKVYMQDQVQEPNGHYTPLGFPVSGRILRVEHMGRLTAPTSSASVELDESRAELLIAQAAVHMFQTLSNTDSGNAVSHLNNSALWLQRVGLLLGQPGIRMRPMSAHERNGWNVDESGETRKLRVGVNSGRW
jgi:hypothetical protein